MTLGSRWDDEFASTLDGPVAECAYASRLLGAETTLVLRGGGNSSVKVRQADLHGDLIDVLHVKGSGHDMADIQVDGFAPVDLERVRRLIEFDELSDTVMLNELRLAQLDVDAPTPSVEAILHAIIPAPAVLHTHTNALLAISNTASGRERVEALYGNRALIADYAMPGFLVAKSGQAVIDGNLPGPHDALVLMNHGLFTFGETSRDAYMAMIELVAMAEAYLAEHSIGGVSPAVEMPTAMADRVDLADLRREISDAAGRPCLLRRHRDPVGWAFSQRPDVARVSQRGVATPDHSIWTKPLPMLGRDVGAFAQRYRDYFADHAAGTDLQMLDPAPRVIIDAEYGLLTAGPNSNAVDAAADIYLQIIDTIEQAEGLGGYVALPSNDIFDLEYWELEQLKLTRHRDAGEFVGEVAVVTGANSGIGRGCALALLQRGAAVVGLDISPDVTSMTDHPAYFGVPCDLASIEQLGASLDQAVERFGGVDMVVAAAGVFPESASIVDLDVSAWRRAMTVNVDALAQLFALAHPLLARSPRHGRVVVIGSKNVSAPGPGASAYSASKAAANQLARVAALEWASDRIRVNSVHPDAVFDTALWSPELTAERAAHYGLTVEQYKTRNLLGVEITSAAVGEMVATMLGPVFDDTTGAHISMDGGTDRTI